MRALAPYTPGPWAIREAALHGTAVEAESSGVGVAWCGCNTVASLAGGVWSIETNEAFSNATLIAAAPDLAQALKALLGEVDEMTSRVGWAGNGARDAARAALAKAGLT